MIKSLPGSLSVRIFLILLSGIFITALVVNLIGQREFRKSESHMRQQFIIERVENVLRILDATIPEKRIEIQEVLSHMGNRVVLNAPALDATQPLPPRLQEVAIQLVPELADQVGLASQKECAPRRHLHPRLDLHGSRPPPPGFSPGPPPGPPHMLYRAECLAIHTALEDGTPLTLYMHYGMRPPPPFARQSYTPLYLGLVLIALITVTWVVASVSTKPLRKLANAARKLTTNIEHPPLPENEGSIEVRQAARAFNEMQRSILLHIKERSFLLGAIAHDLQTPLTRLRLRLEKIKDTALKDSMVSDLNATLEMVREGLDFARLTSENIRKTRVDITALAQAVCDDYAENGHLITRSIPDQPLSVMGSSHLIKRCLNNILSNALLYASQPVLSIHAQGSRVFCTISDDGPGIPEEELSTIFEPFRRVEDSRSRQTGGTGLGLSIARMIVEKHGGQIQMRNKEAPLHGLIISIELPIE